jgi:sugar phosphate isomerase/epimerase
MKISVFTVCMPEFTPEEGARKLGELGFDGVEWRVTTPPAPGEPLVNFWKGNRCTLAPETLPERAEEVRGWCAASRLAMPCLASYLGYADAALVERVMQAAARMQVPLVRVGVARYDGKTNYNRLLDDALKGWATIVALGRKHGVKPVAEIHMGTIIPSAAAAQRFIANFKPEEAGVIHDAGNMVYEGFENLKMGAEMLGPYLAHVHVKNSAWAIQSGDPDGNLRWGCDAATLRRGQINWSDALRALRAAGYDGWISLEDFVPGPSEPKLRDDLAYLQESLARIK